LLDRFAEPAADRALRREHGTDKWLGLGNHGGERLDRSDRSGLRYDLGHQHPDPAHERGDDRCLIGSHERSDDRCLIGSHERSDNRRLDRSDDGSIDRSERKHVGSHERRDRNRELRRRLRQRDWMHLPPMPYAS
jgi:hypothetical protein